MFANSKLVDLFTVGPMCRYAEDLDLLMNVLTEGRYSPSNLVSILRLKIKRNFYRETLFVLQI